MDAAFIQPLLVALSVGIASGSISTFVLSGRMALVGDALSHVALPGIALAIAYSIDPLWGVVVSLTGAALLAWWLEEKTELPTEALIGLFFTVSLAVGILMIPDHELIESLFGGFPNLSIQIFLLVIVVGTALSILTFLLARRFVFINLSRELANVEGIKDVHRLYFLLIFSLIVALGIKLVGTLLMGALTIIPAVIARNIARSSKGYMIFSSVFGGAISTSGVLIAKYFGYLPGPTIIFLGALFFLVSLIITKR